MANPAFMGPHPPDSDEHTGKSRLFWRGQPIDEMTREDLLEKVIPSLMRMLETQRQSIAQERETMETFRQARSKGWWTPEW